MNILRIYQILSGQLLTMCGIVTEITLEINFLALRTNRKRRGSKRILIEVEILR